MVESQLCRTICPVTLVESEVRQVEWKTQSSHPDRDQLRQGDPVRKRCAVRRLEMEQLF